jgi:hypothetical protein
LVIHEQTITVGYAGLPGGRGVFRAVGQLSEMVVQSADAEIASQRASRCRPWQPGTHAISPGV